MSINIDSYKSDISAEIYNYIQYMELKHDFFFYLEECDLKYAFASYYYYYLLKSKKLYKFYCNLHNNSQQKLYVFGTDIEVFVANRLKNKLNIDTFEVRLSIIKKWYLKSKDYFKLTIYQYVSTFFSKKGYSCTDTLFYISNEKFINYLTPLMKSDFFVFLKIFNRGLLSHFYPKGYSFINGYQFKRKSLSNLNLPIQIVSFYLYLKSALVEIRPKRMIVLEGNSYEDRVIEALCRIMNIETLCMQYGWFTNKDIASIQEYRYSKILIWGDYFKYTFPRVHVASLFVLTGSLSVTPLVNPKKQRNKVAFFLNGNSYVYTYVNNIFTKILLEVLNVMGSQEIIVREHPDFPIEKKLRQKLEAHDRCIIMSPDEYLLESVFMQVDVMVSLPSTTILEALACGVIPIVFNPLNSMDYSLINLFNEGCFIETYTVDDLRKWIFYYFENKDQFYADNAINADKISTFFICSKEEAVQKITTQFGSSE